MSLTYLFLWWFSLISLVVMIRVPYQSDHILIRLQALNTWLKLTSLAAPTSRGVPQVQPNRPVSVN